MQADCIQGKASKPMVKYSGGSCMIDCCSKNFLTQDIRTNGFSREILLSFLEREIMADILKHAGTLHSAKVWLKMLLKNSQAG